MFYVGEERPGAHVSVNIDLRAVHHHTESASKSARVGGIQPPRCEPQNTHDSDTVLSSPDLLMLCLPTECAGLQ